jgi:hypothetical protein
MASFLCYKKEIIKKQQIVNILSSVADPGCLSRIPDPKTATKERGKKN